MFSYFEQISIWDNALPMPDKRNWLRLSVLFYEFYLMIRFHYSTVI